MWHVYVDSLANIPEQYATSDNAYGRYMELLEEDRKSWVEEVY